MAALPPQGVLQNRGDARDLQVPATALAGQDRPPPGTSALSLLAALGLERATGLLVLAEAPGRTIEVRVLEGAAVQVERPDTPFTDLVVRSMVSSHVLEAPAVEAARRAHPERPLLQALYAAKACQAGDIVEALRTTREGLLSEALAPGAPAFRWDASVAVKRPDPVGIDLAVFTGSALRLVTRTSYAQDMEPLLEPHMGRYVFRTARLTPALAAQVLNDKEQKVLEVAADGTLTLHEAVAQSLLTRTQTARLFTLCTFLGLLEYRVQGLPRGGVEALETEMKSTLERMKGEDCFQRLGVHWTTHPKHYDAAWRKMLDRWGPASPARRHSETCRQRADEILALMEEAYRTISSDRARRDYRLARMGPDTIRFGTDFLFKQAHLAVFREDWELALEIIESALDILPRPDFAALRADILARTRPR